MAHRGRLAVLAHNLGRSVESILAEFEGAKQIEAVKAVAAIPHGGTGDVKYHYGHQGVYETSAGEKIAVRLYPNPSHLEFVNPVVEGATRFIQSDFEGPTIEHQPKRAVPVLLHGDAAFPGQGVVAETLNLRALKGYIDRRHHPRHPEQPGGLHHRPPGRPLDPLRGRHGEGLQHPDRPRQRRRRRGLLGGDPAGDGLPRALGTGHRHRRDRLPPLRPQRDRRARLHAAADRRQDQGPPAGLRDLRARSWSTRASSPPRRSSGSPRSATTEMSTALKDLRQKMESGEYEDPTVTTSATGELDRSASPPVDTAVPIEKLRSLNEALIKVPESFTIHRKLRKPLAKRIDALEKGGIEFGHAEALAFATLLTEGVHIRLTGQDTERGTFSHRHLVLHDENTGLEYCPMQNLEEASAPFELYNSPLSETACLGFEYGYSAATPERAGPLGGAVRRLRQRRPGDHRQLHRLRRGQVGPDQPPHPAAPARLRGLGARALERPHRALPGARRGGQHPHRQPEHRRPVLPPAAPPGADPQAAAADRLHPEGPAAPRPRRRHAGGADRGRASTSPSTTRPAAERREKVERLVLCTGKIYYDIDANERRDGGRERRDRPGRADLPLRQGTARPS